MTQAKSKTNLISVTTDIYVKIPLCDLWLSVLCEICHLCCFKLFLWPPPFLYWG